MLRGRLRRLFLSGIGSVYLMAFASYYLQFPGLYGNDGILPIANHASYSASSSVDFRRDFSKYLESPTLAAFSPSLQIESSEVIEGGALLGVLLSVLATGGCHHFLVFLALFVLYLSLFVVGQTFLGFQWDIFLLETGAVSLLYAPFSCYADEPCVPGTLALRWLAFKFMLSSGIAKIGARDRTWQDLSAMEYHFASTCLPTYEAWFFHNLPPWALRLCTCITFITEIPAPFLLLLPSPSVSVPGITLDGTFTSVTLSLKWLRRGSAILQVALMIMIMLSGNYNWFNWHYALLMLPVWEEEVDEELTDSSPSAAETIETSTSTSKSTGAHVSRVCGWVWALVQWLLLLLLAAWACAHMFEAALRLDPDSEDTALYNALFTDPRGVHLHMRYTAHDAQRLLDTLLWPLVLPVYALGMLAASCSYVHSSSTSYQLRGGGSSVAVTSGWVGVLSLARCALLLWITGVGCIPFAYSMPGGRAGGKLPTWLEPWAMASYQQYQQFQLVASYGLFRSMTGVGDLPAYARSNTKKWGYDSLPPAVVDVPVVVLSGTSDSGATWHEIEFRYKPGDLMLAPRRTAPHQPRLDWQMWFAALGSIESNPWLLSTMDRLLDGVPEVIDLLDTDRYPFEYDGRADVGTGAGASGDAKYADARHRKPLQAIRAQLYHYDFTRMNTTWGRRVPGVGEMVQPRDWGSASKPYWYRRRPGWQLREGGAEGQDEEGEQYSPIVVDDSAYPVEPGSALQQLCDSGKHGSSLRDLACINRAQLGQMLDQVNLNRRQKGEQKQQQQKRDPCDPAGKRYEARSSPPTGATAIHDRAWGALVSAADSVLESSCRVVGHSRTLLAPLRRSMGLTLAFRGRQFFLDINALVICMLAIGAFVGGTLAAIMSKGLRRRRIASAASGSGTHRQQNTTTKTKEE